MFSVHPKAINLSFCQDPPSPHTHKSTENTKCIITTLIKLIIIICYGLHTVIKINTESFQYLADIGLYTCMVKRSKSKNPSTCILKHIFLVKICDFFFIFMLQNQFVHEL